MFSESKQTKATSSSGDNAKLGLLGFKRRIMEKAKRTASQSHPMGCRCMSDSHISGSDDVDDVQILPNIQRSHSMDNI